MSFDYNIFKKHIVSFDYNKYFNNIDDNFKEKFNNFYNFYLKIIQEEIENTKQLNAKFNKNINEKNKYFKFNRHPPIEMKKVCSFDSIGDENEKLNIIIRTYLNKISDDTYDKVSEQLIEKLLCNKNINIFKILSEEIINKCLFDYKYRNLYINLCSKIWNNKKIHYNLIKINKKDNKYYGEYNINDEEINEIGPYETIDEIKDNLFKKINFKNFFLDFLQELFYNKELDFEHLDDNNFFNKKKKALLLVELLSILFIEKHINFDIINLIIIDLLHQNKNFLLIKEIEFELLYTMIKFIYENNKSFKFIEYKKIIDKFKSILEEILNNNEITKRSNYFVNEIILIFSKILNDQKFNKNNKVNKNNNDINHIISYAEKGNHDNFYYSFKNISENEKENIITILINKILESNKNNNIIRCLKKIKLNYQTFIEGILNNILNNLEDIILDIPDIDSNIKNFINNLELNNNLLVELENKMEIINDSENNSEDSDDNFSFRKK